MDNFNNINYQNFEEDDITNNVIDANSSKELYSKPIYRKLNIVHNQNQELSSVSSNGSIEDQNVIPPPANFSIDLYSSAPYTMRNKIENKYFDSETMTSFNNIDDLYNQRYAGNYEETRINDGIIENMKLEVDDNKNILRSNLQKLNNREDKLQSIEEKSKTLIEGADKFKRKSRTLYYYMFVKYLWHTFAIVLLLIILTIVIASLVNN